MDSYSPVVKDAIRLLNNNLYEHLDEAEYIAADGTWSDDEAQRLVLDLITVVRGLIIVHERGEAATCRTCGAQWPCQAFQAIHRLLKDPTLEFVKIRERAASS